MDKGGTNYYSKRALDILSRTLYGEARGENVRGLEAVACVVLNRVKKAKERGTYWWGNTVEDVCLKPWQFSCWNQNDPNREKILKVTKTDAVFAACLRIARRALNGAINDPTCGATHYHRQGLLPPWAQKEVPVCEIGHHLFYKNIP